MNAIGVLALADAALACSIVIVRWRRGRGAGLKWALALAALYAVCLFFSYVRAGAAFPVILLTTALTVVMLGSVSGSRGSADSFTKPSVYDLEFIAKIFGRSFSARVGKARRRMVERQAIARERGIDVIDVMRDERQSKH